MRCRRSSVGASDGSSDGALKELALHRDGLIVLPPPTRWQSRPRPIAFGQDTEPPLIPMPTTLDDVRPLDMRPIVRGTREGKRWNEFIARYHYLGDKTPVGAQMRYAVHDRSGWPIAMLGFSIAAWKLAPRANFSGWTPPLREKNLPSVADSPRFLILPWITIPNLGSHLLALVRPRTGPSVTTPRPCSLRPSSRPRDTEIDVATKVAEDMCSLRPSSRPRDTSAPSTRSPAGAVSAPARGAGDTTHT